MNQQLKNVCDQQRLVSEKPTVQSIAKQLARLTHRYMFRRSKSLVKGLVVAGLAGSISTMAVADNFVSKVEDGITTRWAISQFGDPDYLSGLEHWPYVNPDRAKGRPLSCWVTSVLMTP